MSNMDDVSLSIAEDAFSFETLFRSIYDNPLISMVRELTRNAFDAHQVSGTDRKVDMKLTNDLFYIRDYGNGISPEELKSLVSVMMKSSKRGDASTTGGYGLGSKTPFSLLLNKSTSNSCTMTSICDGIKTVYDLQLDDKGRPLYKVISSTETDEHSGVSYTANIQGCHTTSLSLDTYVNLFYPMIGRVNFIGFDYTSPLYVSKDVEYDVVMLQYVETRHSLDVIFLPKECMNPKGNLDVVDEECKTPLISSICSIIGSRAFLDNRIGRHNINFFALATQTSMNHTLPTSLFIDGLAYSVSEYANSEYTLNSTFSSDLSDHNYILVYKHLMNIISDNYSLPINQRVKLFTESSVLSLGDFIQLSTCIVFKADEWDGFHASRSREKIKVDDGNSFEKLTDIIKPTHLYGDALSENRLHEIMARFIFTLYSTIKDFLDSEHSVDYKVDGVLYYHADIIALYHVAVDHIMNNVKEGDTINGISGFKINRDEVIRSLMEDSFFLLVDKRHWNNIYGINAKAVSYPDRTNMMNLMAKVYPDGDHLANISDTYLRFIDKLDLPNNVRLYSGGSDFPIIISGNKSLTIPNNLDIILGKGVWDKKKQNYALQVDFDEWHSGKVVTNNNSYYHPETIVTSKINMLDDNGSLRSVNDCEITENTLFVYRDSKVTDRKVEHLLNTTEYDSIVFLQRYVNNVIRNFDSQYIPTHSRYKLSDNIYRSIISGHNRLVYSSDLLNFKLPKKTITKTVKSPIKGVSNTKSTPRDVDIFEGSHTPNRTSTYDDIIAIIEKYDTVYLYDWDSLPNYRKVSECDLGDNKYSFRSDRPYEMYITSKTLLSEFLLVPELGDGSGDASIHYDEYVRNNTDTVTICYKSSTISNALLNYLNSASNTKDYKEYFDEMYDAIISDYHLSESDMKDIEVFKDALKHKIIVGMLINEGVTKHRTFYPHNNVDPLLINFYDFVSGTNHSRDIQYNRIHIDGSRTVASLLLKEPTLFEDIKKEMIDEHLRIVQNWGRVKETHEKYIDLFKYMWVGICQDRDTFPITDYKLARENLYSLLEKIA